MAKRISSTQGWLDHALQLARKSQFEAAQKALGKVLGRELTSNELRMAAQVNNRCGQLGQAEVCWLEVERRNHMDPGDYYMLGSLMVQMSKFDLAVKFLGREIEVAAKTGNDYFVDSATIKLADLLIRMNNLSGARTALASIDNSASEYVDGVGLRTKAAMLREIDDIQTRS